MLPAAATPLQRAALANVLTNQRQTSLLQQEQAILGASSSSTMSRGDHHVPTSARNSFAFPKLEEPWVAVTGPTDVMSDAINESMERSISYNSSTTTTLTTTQHTTLTRRRYHEEGRNLQLRSQQMLSQQRKVEQQALRKAFQ